MTSRFPAVLVSCHTCSILLPGLTSSWMEILKLRWVSWNPDHCWISTCTLAGRTLGGCRCRSYRGRSRWHLHWWTVCWGRSPWRGSGTEVNICSLSSKSDQFNSLEITLKCPRILNSRIPFWPWKVHELLFRLTSVSAGIKTTGDNDLTVALTPSGSVTSLTPLLLTWRWTNLTTSSLMETIWSEPSWSSSLSLARSSVSGVVSPSKLFCYSKAPQSPLLSPLLTLLFFEIVFPSQCTGFKPAVCKGKWWALIGLDSHDTRYDMTWPLFPCLFVIYLKSSPLLQPRNRELKLLLVCGHPLREEELLADHGLHSDS